MGYLNKAYQVESLYQEKKTYITNSKLQSLQPCRICFFSSKIGLIELSQKGG